MCEFRPMTLAQYLEQTGTRLIDFAKTIGESPSTVHDWKSGRRTPRLYAVIKIERATNDSVRARDFSPAARDAA